MTQGPDDNVDKLLQDIDRVISDNKQFLKNLLDDNIDSDDESLPDLQDTEDFEEL